MTKSNFCVTFKVSFAAATFSTHHKDLLSQVSMLQVSPKSFHLLDQDLYAFLLQLTSPWFQAYMAHLYLFSD